MAKWTAAGILVLAGVGGMAAFLAKQDGSTRVSVGRAISPGGKSIGVGSYPLNMVLSPDGKYTIVTTVGFREQLSVISNSDGSLVSSVDFNARPKGVLREGLYYGLVFRPGTNELYVSQGAQDLISKFTLSADGKLEKLGEPISTPPTAPRKTPNHIAGLAFSSDGKTLLAVHNQTVSASDYKGGLAVIDAATGTLTKRIEVGGYPFDVVMTKAGKAFVGCERDAKIDVVDVAAGTVSRSIRTGDQPVDLLLSEAGDRIYVANSGSDTISVVDVAKETVIGTIMLRPPAMRGLPGVAPVGLTLSRDGRQLFAACADLNAVAVIDLEKQSVTGYLPTGWLPTSIVADPSGRNLLISSAKGIRARNPNGKPVGEWGRYIQDIIEGTVTLVEIPQGVKMQSASEESLAAALVREGLDAASYPGFTDPGIEHVIYVIKENRTYDNVFGDLPQGNGDPSLCLFPRKVTPNQHALAERFVLLDNFHVCAEVSQDGWVWSTAGMISQYASRNTPYNYSKRGRTYDTEGANSGIPVDLIDIPDVSRPPSGYIWEHCKKHNVSFRNYGFFVQSGDPDDKRYDVFKTSQDNQPAKKALIGMTDTNFRRYDLNYADGDAWERYGKNWPKQRKTFGSYNMPSRFQEFKREFDQFLKNGSMPQFMMVRMGNDHTSGTAVGQPTPSAMVAENDYAVGQLVELVSNSPIWKKTAICILEDDAQNGYDHVDAHRSIAFVISPYIKRGTIDSRFYNTDSMLRTMELLLGLPPMSQFDAVATPIMAFGPSADNAEPYKAILPPEDIVTAVNTKESYRAADSAKISLYIEESEVDEDLNDILWGAIKGRHVPRPKVRNSVRVSQVETED